MTTFSRSHQQKIALILGLVVVAFLVFQTAPRNAPSDGQQETIVQIVENTTIPILLAGSSEQHHLQLNAIIQRTPVAQIRLFELSDNMLLRVQNGAIAIDDPSIRTVSRNVAFEGNVIGRFEVDIRQTHADNQSAYRLWSLAVTLGLGGLLTLILFWTQWTSASTAEAENTITAADDDPHARPNTPTHVSTQHEGLLIAIKVGSAFTGPAATEAFVDRIERLADIYDTELVSTAPQRLLLRIHGKPNYQRIQQALVLSWGLTQLIEEPFFNGHPAPTLSVGIVDGRELQPHVASSYAYWNAVESMLQDISTGKASIQTPLAKKVDGNSFDISTGDDWSEIQEASGAIRRLWERQKANIV